jgi:hypothetical protein
VKNKMPKKLILPLTVILILAIGIIIYLSLQNKAIKQTATPSTPDTTSTNSFPSTPSEFGTWVSVTKGPDSAKEEMKKLTPHLPIKIEGFETSAKITTSINIHILPDDPDTAVRLEIYGPNYNQSDPSLKNPNTLAFKESFLKAKEIIKSHNVDPTKLQIIYGPRQYIQQTASIWVDTLGLLN